MRRPPALVPALAAAALAGGCADERTPAPPTAVPLSPQGSADLRFADAGVRFAAPGRWDRATGQAPLVATVSSGRATVAVWRFARAEPLPRSAGDMARARRGLLAAAKARDPSFRESSARVRRLRGRRALDVRGTGTVEGQGRSVRSVHVFAFGGEVVVDALAPPRDAARVDREVVRPLLRSLRLFRPRPAG